MSAEERAEVKQVSRLLLGRWNQLLVRNGRLKSMARSRLKLASEATLEIGRPGNCAKLLSE